MCGARAVCCKHGVIIVIRLHQVLAFKPTHTYVCDAHIHLFTDLTFYDVTSLQAMTWAQTGKPRADGAGGDAPKPDVLVDVATLTGACVVALGEHAAVPCSKCIA
jgi:hypothetical protein